MSKTLIYAALACEAQNLIDFYKLTQDKTVQKKTIKLYSNDDIILLIGGMGKDKTLLSLQYVFENYEVHKAINIGIAGCSDSSVKVGTLFCTNKFVPGINFAPITTVDEPLQSDEELETLLVDMEAKYFIESCKAHINDFYVFKVVSDHLDAETPKDSFVIDLMKNSFNKWKSFI